MQRCFSDGEEDVDEMMLSRLYCGGNFLAQKFLLNAPKHLTTTKIGLSPLAATQNVRNSSSNPLNLPSMPVPPLQKTLEKYLKSVEPFLNEQELKKTKEVVNKFSSGVGQKLQELLVKKAKTTDNWLSEWWINVAYLEYRDPVVVFSSPGLVFPFQKFNSEKDRLSYTAKLILASIDYKLLIDADKIPQEKMGKDLLDMSQYKKIFGTCRVPGIKKDSLEYHPTSKHIVVVKNNNYFKLQVLDENNKMSSEKQLVQQLESIVKSSEKEAFEIGVLTTENRNAWGKAYQELIKDEKNKTSIKEIQKSLFLVCLDKPLPSSKSERPQVVASKQFIHGGGSVANAANRWYDKTIQFVISEDGCVGLTYEHSPSEGQPIAIMLDYLVDYMKNNASASVADVSNPGKPKKLEFSANDSIKKAIQEANSNVNKLVKDLDMDAFTFESFGKEFIKSQRLSPDSFIQMAMQYAFYRLHKVPAAHYESAALRKFIHGRTETIRSCSNESVSFAKAMLDQSKSADEKAKALRAAVDAHKKYTIDALFGFGADRHLLGLKLIALENNIEIPDFYKDPSFTRSTYMRISSSQVATKHNGFMCYAPLVKDGYGCCYNPRKNDMNFAVSAFVSHPDTSATKFRESLENSLTDMQKVLAKTQKSKL